MNARSTPDTKPDAQPIWNDLMGCDDTGAFLVGGKCAGCGFTTLGLRDICPNCWENKTMAKVAIGRHGTLYTYSVVHQLPLGFDKTFAVGYVDIDDGVRVFAHLENTPESLTIGARLELVSAILRQDDAGVPLTGPRYQTPRNKGDN